MYLEGSQSEHTLPVDISGAVVTKGGRTCQMMTVTLFTSSLSRVSQNPLRP